MLAWLAVKNKFNTYLRVSCPYAKIEIDRFVSLIEKFDEQLNISQMESQEDEQNNFAVASQDTPKVLADIFGSVAGAIYRDSGDQIDVVWRVYQPLMESALQLF